MTLLALTTSGARAQVGLFQPQTSLILENSNPRQHSEWLHGAVFDLLQKFKIDSAALNGIAVDIGPGSFTGLRVGFQLAQSLTFANQTPLLTVTNPQILAYGLVGPVIVATNAFRNLVYYAEYDSGRELVAPKVESVDVVAERLVQRQSAGSAFTAAGDAFTKIFELQKLKIIPAVEFPSAESLAQLAFQAGPDLWSTEWKSKSPLYLRGSEAEEKTKLKSVH